MSLNAAASVVTSSSRFWAKLAHNRSAWHPLAAHSADVAAVTRRLLQEDSTLPTRLARLGGGDALSPPDIALVTFLAAIHDIGKVNHGFQERRHSNTRERRVPWEGHVRILLRSLSYSPLAQAIEDCVSPLQIDDDLLRTLWLAAICHHGQPYALKGRGAVDTAVNPARLWSYDPESGRKPLAEIRRLGRLAVRWSELEKTGSPGRVSADPRITHLFAGIVTLADWIASTETAFPLQPDAEEDLDRYWSCARERADRACREIGVVASRSVISLSGASLYERLFPAVFGSQTGNEPTELQEEAASMELPPPGSRILIESETGSGKTEAALALYLRLRNAGQVGGLMFALPTRATSRAMYERVSKSLSEMYGDDIPHVALAIGGADPEVHTANETLAAPELRYDDDDSVSRLRMWASKRAKKFLAAEIVVGTVDQALLSSLAVRHAHLRLAALSRHLLVVDEVHSHDRYMLEALRTVLDFHTAAGGMAVLMSATLSQAARDLLGKDGGGDPFAVATGRPYPVLSVSEADADWDDRAMKSAGEGKTVEWRLASEREGLKEALESATVGGRICILRNTVKDAQQTVEELEDLDATDYLWRPARSNFTPAYHSRYGHHDRRALDDDVLKVFGKGADSQSGGIILVSTQVVEQSLDVDFDLLVTDLCPVDVLLQRIGRLHRHTSRDHERRAPYGQPRAIVLAPPEPFEPTRDFRGPQGWGTVYKNLPALELTRRLIGEHSTIHLPADNRLLVEKAFHSSRWDELRAEGWDDPVNEIEGTEFSHVSAARDALLCFESTYSENASRYRKEARIRTRLGDDRVRVELDPPAPCWYAGSETIDHVDLRLREVEGTDVDLGDPRIGPGRTGTDNVMEYQLGDQILRYEPTGWKLRG